MFFNFLVILSKFFRDDLLCAFSLYGAETCTVNFVSVTLWNICEFFQLFCWPALLHHIQLGRVLYIKMVTILPDEQASQGCLRNKYNYYKVAWLATDSVTHTLPDDTDNVDLHLNKNEAVICKLPKTMYITNYQLYMTCTITKDRYCQVVNVLATNYRVSHCCDLNFEYFSFI